MNRVTADMRLKTGSRIFIQTELAERVTSGTEVRLSGGDTGCGAYESVPIHRLQSIYDAPDSEGFPGPGRSL
jgi:hypothetical protein